LTGRFGLVAVGLLQCHQQGLALRGKTGIDAAGFGVGAGLSPCNAVGQMLRAYPAAGTQSKGLLDGVAQLTYIAGPGIGQQGVQGLRRQPFNDFTAALVVLSNKILDQGRDVFHTAL